MSRRSVRRLIEPWRSAPLIALILCLIAGMASLAVGPAVAASPDRSPAASLARYDDDDDDDGGDDDDDDDEGASGSTPGNGGNSGNGGNGSKDKPAKDDKKAEKAEKKENKGKPGNAATGDDPELAPVIVVEAAAEYHVTVGCHVDDDGERSTCIFAGLATGPGDRISGLAAPESGFCAPVIGGSFVRADDDDGTEVASLDADLDDAEIAWYTTSDAYRGPALLSAAPSDVVAAVFEGVVSTGGSTTYWLRVADEVVAATGPGLRCDQPADLAAELPAAATGAIVIHVFACPAGSSGAAATDWFARCTRPGAGAGFTITRLDAELADTSEATAADDGLATVEALPAGRYQIDQTGQNWCYAESDNVNDRGEVVVADGQQSTVWIFNCTAGDAAATGDAAK